RGLLWAERLSRPLYRGRRTGRLPPFARAAASRVHNNVHHQELLSRGGRILAIRHAIHGVSPVEVSSNNDRRSEETMRARIIRQFHDTSRRIARCDDVRASDI